MKILIFQIYIFSFSRYDTLPVFSGVSLTAEVVPSEEGIWLLSSTSAYHKKGEKLEKWGKTYIMIKLKVLL